MKIGGSIDISRAVDPTMSLFPVANWKLHELVARPAEEGLPTFVGTNDDVNRLS